MKLNKLIESYQNGTLNEYMYKKLLKAVEKGSSDKLVDELVQDARDASDIGVTNDREYNIYFRINHLLDDMLQDTFDLALDDTKKKDLKHHIFSHKDNEKYKFDNLIDFRILIYDWLADKIATKKAYPNIAGKTEREIIYDIDKWIATLKNIYACIREKQADKGDAIRYFTQAWDSDEKQHFVNWLKYYEEGNMEKYNVKNAQLTKEADIDFAIPQAWVRDDARDETTPNISTRKINQEKTRRERELERAKDLKKQMRSRLLSFKRRLEQFNDILPKQNLDSIFEEIHKLEISISKLDVYASMQDCLYRSANIIRKYGYDEGAEFLEKLAVPEKQPASPSAQAINVQAVIARLERVSKTLNARDIIRELASVDILLNELGVASHFPELSLSQAKLIEAFSYSSNKIEDIISNLRGGGVNRLKSPEIKPSEVKTVPPSKPMDTGEIMNKPIGEVKQELPTAAAPKKIE